MAVSSQAAPVNFSVAQRAAHWLTVLFIAWQFIVPASGAFEKAMAVRAAAKKAAEVTAQGGTPDPVPQLDALTGLMLQSHFIVGGLIILLTLYRLFLRFTQGAPAAPESEPKALQLVAKVTHGLLYVVLFAMPLSGIGFRYLGLDFLHFPHEGPIKALMIVLIALHIVGALAHQFYFKTDVMARMTRGV